MKRIKQLLLKMGIFKNAYKTPEQIHNEKINKINNELLYVKDDLIKLLPEGLRKEFFDKSYISGGCIYSLYHGKEPKDYDFFVESDYLGERLREYFLNQTTYKGDLRSGGLYKDINMTITQNAISLGRYQIITQWIGKPEEVINQFDFKHNMTYWKNGKVVCLSDWKFVRGNKIYYNEGRARDIVGTIVRLPRFVERRNDSK
ncbi:hypothetical protein SAMN04487895_101614 [Paenibacillus sophorae]|uniref:Uncharacterized protein n=1 Tax=Paenibacillus sophorae TaxID=1333845 RepID=A0A1H8GRJ8_9BACL|nr:hypothetical protein [Paenibacillus sophorae]SEN46439.1 hypothetical protein SAMN04487895_101614 [Paenibacillus sophorae]